MAMREILAFKATTDTKSQFLIIFSDWNWKKCIFDCVKENYYTYMPTLRIYSNLVPLKSISLIGIHVYYLNCNIDKLSASP
jgi:hypothetical protein